MTDQPLADLKLYMLLLGSKAPDRNVEQHDYYFAIGRSLKELVPGIRKFWKEAGNSIHIDGWREINFIDGHQIKVIPRVPEGLHFDKRLFFINLGGYQSGKLEEQHYTVLSVHETRSHAIQDAKKTVFFKTNTIKGAGSHIDEKYGIDVDDIYLIEDILPEHQKALYHIVITPTENPAEDPIHLGYFKLDKIR